VRLISGALALALATACVGPSRTTRDYEKKAANTAQAVVGALGTAELAIELAAKDRAYANTLSVTLTEAERDASGAQGSFDSVQPPAGAAADDVRTRLDDLLTQATGTLTNLRITARRGHLKALSEVSTDLKKLIHSLDEFESKHGVG
jgi:hypothetical protein